MDLNFFLQFLERNSDSVIVTSVESVKYAKIHAIKILLRKIPPFSKRDASNDSVLRGRRVL